MAESDAHTDELDLRAYFRPIWRRKWLILILVIVAAAGSYAVSSRAKKSYSASATIYVTSGVSASAGTSTAAATLPVTPTALTDIADLVTSQAVYTQADKDLGVPATSLGSVTATAATTASFVYVTASGPTAKGAAKLANTFVSAYLQVRRRHTIQQAKLAEGIAKKTLTGLLKVKKGAAATALTGERTSLAQTIISLREEIANPPAGASQIATAYPPNSPTSPKPQIDTIFGGAVGLVLGIVLAYLFELLDRRLLDISTIESLLKRPVLAVLPHVGDPTPVLAGRLPVVPSGFIEQLRSLTVMLRMSSDRPPRSIMVTSTLPQEGKSTITRDLAITYAEGGARVLIIDCDLRRPSMERFFALEGTKGLVHVVRDGLPLTEAIVRGAPRHFDEPVGDVVTDGAVGAELEGFVDVLTHGEGIESPLTLMESPRMVEVLDEAMARYDVVLIDTPPVLAVADTIPLMEKVDCVLLVTRLGQTTRQVVHGFNDLLERVGDVNFAGVVANDRRIDRSDYYGYGGYAYGYGRGSRRSRRKESRRARKAAEARRPAATSPSRAEPELAGVAATPAEAPGAAEAPVASPGPAGAAGLPAEPPTVADTAAEAPTVADAPALAPEAPEAAETAADHGDGAQSAPQGADAPVAQDGAAASDPTENGRVPSGEGHSAIDPGSETGDDDPDLPEQSSAISPE